MVTFSLTALLAIGIRFRIVLSCHHLLLASSVNSDLLIFTCNFSVMSTCNTGHLSEQDYTCTLCSVNHTFMFYCFLSYFSVLQIHLIDWLIDWVKVQIVKQPYFLWHARCFLPGARIPLLNVHAQPARYPAMVLLFLWKLHMWFLIRIKFHPQSVGKWIAILSVKNYW